MTAPPQAPPSPASAQVHCHVQASLWLEQSDPQAGRWAYRYQVTLENRGVQAVQIVGRHWVIADLLGRVHEVRGLALVGHQPVIGPGERFEYESWTPLEMAQGSLRGRFLAVTEAAEPFWVEAAEVLLAPPGALH